MDPLLHTGEVAAMLDLSRSTLRRAVIRGDVPATLTPGGHYRFRLSDVIEFARACRIAIEIPEGKL